MLIPYSYLHDTGISSSDLFLAGTIVLSTSIEILLTLSIGFVHHDTHMASKHDIVWNKSYFVIVCCCSQEMCW